MTGNVAVTRLLIKLPALDINLGDNEGNTALHLAAQAGCPNKLYRHQIMQFYSNSIVGYYAYYVYN